MADIEKSAAGPRAVAGRRLTRVLVAAAVSALSLALLIGLVDRASLGAAVGKLSPSAIGLASALFLLSLALRGYWLRLLAPGGDARLPLAHWVRLAVAHQSAFMLLPSGAGDLGFPLLAGRITGVGFAAAVRMILCYRLQDLLVLAMLGIAALALIGFDAGASPVILGVPLLAVPALVWSSDLARLGAFAVAQLLRSATRVLHGERFGRVVAAADRMAGELTAATDAGRRFKAALACTGAWAATCAYVWVLFAMVGVELSAAEVVVVVAGLNLAGALASFSIAGIGVSEGGLAAVLVLLGFATQEALSTALVVRPIILLNALLVCGLAEGGFRLVTLVTTAPTRPTVGTAAGPGRSS
jgi:uncharacterized membrane protein YbhN (UPF0104 family)